MSTPDERARLTRRGFWLEYASMAWMTVEAAVAITAGIAAASIALLAFGLDSVIEFFAAAIVVWQLRGGSSERETRAVRFIGITFFVLAAYLTVEGIHDLTTHAKPEVSRPGLMVTAAALLVMPLLAWAKQRTGQALGNRTLWIAPVILEALIPGRMQSHASTAEVSRGAARARGEDGARDP